MRIQEQNFMRALKDAQEASKNRLAFKHEVERAVLPTLNKAGIRTYTALTPYPFLSKLKGIDAGFIVHVREREKYREFEILACLEFKKQTTFFKDGCEFVLIQDKQLEIFYLAVQLKDKPILIGVEKLFTSSFKRISEMLKFEGIQSYTIDEKTTVWTSYQRINNFKNLLTH